MWNPFLSFTQPFFFYFPSFPLVDTVFQDDFFSTLIHVPFTFTRQTLQTDGFCHNPGKSSHHIWPRVNFILR